MTNDEAVRNMERLEIQNRIGINELQEKMDNNLLPSEMRDKMRFGGNYLNVREGEKGKYSGFYVLVSGHIESG